MKNNKDLNEIWKPVMGFPGYFVSNWGQIMSKKRDSNGKLRKLRKDKDGYLRVNLLLNGKISTRYVHRLVALHFCDNPDPAVKTAVNHLVENKLNNNAENLQWVTETENVRWGYLAQRNRIKSRREYSARNPGRYSRGLAQRDKEGNLLRTFSSAREAADFFMENGVVKYVNPNSLTDVACGRYPHWHGFKFEYLAGTGLQPINTYDKDGNLLKTYDTLAEAEKELKIRASMIRRAAVGERKTCHGYKFAFVNPPR